MSARRTLIHELREHALVIGEVTLTSGRKARYLIDAKRAILRPAGFRALAELTACQARQRGARAVGGITMGADPIVVAVSVVSRELHGFLVRKSEKQHGTGQRIEGFREKGACVVIVDDVCTTGASTVQAIEAAREFGFEVIGVMCLVEREEAKGRANVEKAAAPAPFIAIFQAGDVRQEHLKHPSGAAPPIFAVAASCELCGRPAVTNVPRNRCAAHQI